MNTNHPDAGFVHQLENELRATIRRRQQFANGEKPGRVPARKRRLGIVILAVGAMMFGSAATFAVTRGLNAQMADLVIARAEAVHELSMLRLHMMSQGLQEAQATAETGNDLGVHHEFLRMEVQLADLDSTVTALNLEESRTTGREADASLSAPLVGRRDFVSDRLQAEREGMMVRMVAMKMEAEKYPDDSQEVSGLIREVESIHASMQALDERLRLRREYLDGKLTAREVELADMGSGLEQDRQRLMHSLDALRSELERLQAVNDGEEAYPRHRRALMMELRSTELRLRLADIELEALERKLGRAE